MKKKLFLILRTALAVFSVICSGFFIVPMFGGIINIGNIAGAFLFIWLFAVSFKPLNNFIKSLCQKHKFSKFMYKLINFCFVVFLAYGIVVTGAMVYCANQKPEENSTAVILGAQVKPWGPSIMLMGRIDAGYDYLTKNTSADAVLSGGQGSDEPMSEAQSMLETLLEKGIGEDRLFVEDKSTNTTENIDFSMKVIKENKLNEDIAIVTDGFHQLRARIIVKQLGIKTKVGAINSDASFFYLPTFIVREWFALPYQILFR